MPDVHDVTLMSEQYKSPPVSVGQLVMYRKGKNPIWDIGWVVAANPKTWKPGDPAGKPLNIRICPRGYGEPLILEDCYHVNDPAYVFDQTGSRSCWENPGIEAKSVSDMVSLYNELLEELKVAKANEGELVKLKAELAQIRQVADNANESIAKLSATVSFLKAPKSKDKDAA